MIYTDRRGRPQGGTHQDVLGVRQGGPRLRQEQQGQELLVRLRGLPARHRHFRGRERVPYTILRLNGSEFGGKKISVTYQSDDCRRKDKE